MISGATRSHNQDNLQFPEQQIQNRFELGELLLLPKEQLVELSMEELTDLNQHYDRNPELWANKTECYQIAFSAALEAKSLEPKTLTWSTTKKVLVYAAITIAIIGTIAISTAMISMQGTASPDFGSTSDNDGMCNDGSCEIPVPSPVHEALSGELREFIKGSSFAEDNSVITREDMVKETWMMFAGRSQEMMPESVARSIGFKTQPLDIRHWADRRWVELTQNRLGETSSRVINEGDPSYPTPSGSYIVQANSAATALYCQEAEEECEHRTPSEISNCIDYFNKLDKLLMASTLRTSRSIEWLAEKQIEEEEFTYGAGVVEEV